jgi:hypothetical protein
MSDFGWQLVVDSIKQKPCKEPFKVELIKRMYKNDIPSDEMEKILNAYRKL